MSNKNHGGSGRNTHAGRNGNTGRNTHAGRAEKKRRIIAAVIAFGLVAVMVAAIVVAAIPAKAETADTGAEGNANTPSGGVTLRIANWEEYFDVGDWDEEDTIDLESGDIIGEDPMIHEFEEWYEETYGIPVNVVYSTFGTNEDLYNMLTLGDVYDLVCPSEYMIMKLMDEGALVPLSDEFFDEENEYNYYIRGLSPYLRDIFETKEINGEPWGDYMAGYMWGITGIVYNPEEVPAEDVTTLDVLRNPEYYRQVTIKDNVRDSYFAAVAAVKKDLLTSEEFLNDPNYSERLEEEMNDVSPETVEAVQEFLQEVRDNAYSFETESGKADMITGKVLINYQWSGDSVYTLDQADEDDFTLAFSVPEEASNIYFDGWVMLKSGIEEDPAKQHAAEAFLNYISRPDNVIRNMYYTGYTSVISGGDDDRIFEYLDWCYGAEEDEEDVEDYPVGYFFSGDSEDEDYVITAPSDQIARQLFSQYPSEEAISHTSIMTNFSDEEKEAINRMWINVRCFDIRDVPVWLWIIVAAVAALCIWAFIRHRRIVRSYTGDAGRKL